MPDAIFGIRFWCCQQKREKTMVRYLSVALMLSAMSATAEDWRDIDVRTRLDTSCAAAAGPVVTEVSSCYYSTVTQTIQTAGAQCHIEWLPAVTETKYDHCGRPCGTRVVKPARCVRVVTPPKYETRTKRVFNHPSICTRPACGSCEKQDPARRELTQAPDRGLRRPRGLYRNIYQDNSFRASNAGYRYGRGANGRNSGYRTATSFR